MRTRFLTFWSALSAKHPALIVITALIITILALINAQDMKMTSRWSDLLPLKDPKVREFDNIIREFKNVSNSLIVIQGDEYSIKKFADEIAPRIRNMKDDVERIDYKIEKDFLTQHGFMLTKERYLKDMPDLYQNLNLIFLITHINDNFEKVYTGEEQSLSSKEKEDNAVLALDGIHYWLQTLEKYTCAEEIPPTSEAYQAVERLLLGDNYYISPDKHTLIMMVEPTFSVMDIDRVVSHVDTMQAIIDEALSRYPGVQAGLTGTVPLCRDEMVYSMNDLGKTSLLGLTLIVILFILSFRVITAPLLAALNLIMGILWTLGVSAFFLSSLNIMTSMFGVILIGLGIDFSIHIISVYNESRHLGNDIAESMKATFHKSGAGIITGALTTSCAFFTLMISQSRGIKEMGLILGVGIICAMLATILVLPSILILREKIIGRFRKGEIKTANVVFPFLGNLSATFQRKPIIFISIGLILTAFLLYQAVNVKFDYNYLNMEPKGIPSVTLQDSVIKAFNISSDLVLVTAESLERAREIAQNARDYRTVGLVESVTDYIPSPAQYSARLPYLQQIAQNLNQNHIPVNITVNDFPILIEELIRLNKNIYELSQMAFLGGQERVDEKCQSIIGSPGNPQSENSIIELIKKLESSDFPTLLERLNKFQSDYLPEMRRLLLQMANTDPITIDDLPQSITNRFFNEDQSKMLISIYPSGKVWDLEFLSGFTRQMERVDPHITGMPPMFLHLVNYIGRDGKISTVLALIVVFLLLLFDFRSLRMSLLGMVPLVVGATWMVGTMKLLGLELTFVNVMAIPMIVGIGIDDGVHILHRYRIEGKSKIKEVMNSTGKAVMLTSLTTMMGFGSLLIAQYRGFASLASLLVIGVAACFCATILFLPSFLGLFDRKPQ